MDKNVTVERGALHLKVIDDEYSLSLSYNHTPGKRPYTPWVADIVVDADGRYGAMSLDRDGVVALMDALMGMLCQYNTDMEGEEGGEVSE